MYPHHSKPGHDSKDATCTSPVFPGLTELGAAPVSLTTAFALSSLGVCANPPVVGIGTEMPDQMSLQMVRDRPAVTTSKTAAEEPNPATSLISLWITTANCHRTYNPLAEML